MFSKLMRKARKNQKGFTLVELMVVVVIIGILTAIAVPVYNNVTAKAELGAIQANLRTIDGAIMMMTSTEADEDVDTVDEAIALLPSYLQAVPTSPGTYTIIGTDGDVTTYRAQVTTTGEGGIDAGDYTLSTLPE